MEANNTMMSKLKTTFISVLTSLIAFVPTASAYLIGPQVGMLNPWDIFVEQIFGSFWAAVLFLAIIFFILLMLGGISFYTVIIFELYFILAMAIGYGYPLFVFPILFASVIYLIWQIFKLLFENR